MVSVRSNTASCLMALCSFPEEILQKSLGPEFIANRVGPGNAKLFYIEGRTAINLANEVFGYDGWSSEVLETVTDFIDVDDRGRVSLGIAARVRVTLKCGTYHEDWGYGSFENAKTKADAFEKARKESVTDGLKRALRLFGDVMGNCIYDKNYLRNIGNMAKPAARKKRKS
ncbi:Rad52/22 double-strand break repair protein [Hesseltinella vesiculosa]|uniref:Rad52/22 double-strand break repair protein n=1 Tax=Hesseltinella vesiculosa TaxID=101127 RepID=A0A1X2GN50_9FUNG|nr:Rad52/22 double-strand break repair protein [Hesseltinella vesiculosa]